MTFLDIKRDPGTGQYTVQLRMTEVEALQFAQQIIRAKDGEPVVTDDPTTGGDAESEDRIA